MENEEINGIKLRRSSEAYKSKELVPTTGYSEDHKKLLESILKKDAIYLSKHSSLVSMTNPFTTTGHKIFNALYYNAKLVLDNIDPDEDLHIIDLETLEELTQTKIKNNITYLKKTLDELMDNKFELNMLGKVKEEFGKVQVISGYYYKNNKITYELPSIIKEILIKKEMYAKIDLKEQNTLKNKHALIIYEICVDNRFISEFEIKQKTFRKILNLNNKYKSNYELKRSVLEPAQKEINEKTEMKIEINTIIRNRTIDSVKIKILKRQQNNQPTTPQIIAIKNILNKLKINFTEKEIYILRQYKLETLNKAYKTYLEKDPHPKSPIAYFIDMVNKYSERGYYTIDELEEKKEINRQELANNQKEILEKAGIKEGALVGAWKANTTNTRPVPVPKIETSPKEYLQGILGSTGYRLDNLRVDLMGGDLLIRASEEVLIKALGDESVKGSDREKIVSEADKFGYTVIFSVTQ